MEIIRDQQKEIETLTHRLANATHHHQNSKRLSRDEKNAIRNSTTPRLQLARQYNVSERTIRHIKKYRNDES